MSGEWCPAMFEDAPGDRFMGDIHEVGKDARWVTTPIVGGGAARILFCSEHADVIQRRFGAIR